MDPVSASTPGLALVEHELTVPLDHLTPHDGRTITLFAREIADVDGPERPYLVFLSGGPGFEGPRPGPRAGVPGFLNRALRDFRVLVLDGRGTGRSSPVGPATAADRTPEQLAEYLSHFRADAIVRDLELLREALGSPPWTVLGQSFGGFCVLSYLSIAPDGLRRALITGGLPALDTPVSEVYRHTWARVGERGARYLERYPGDRARLAALRATLAGGPVLPDGSTPSVDRVRGLGLDLGMSVGADALHGLLELPFDSPAFRWDLAAAGSFQRNPIYAVLHEACWADGGVSGWAAERIRPESSREDPDAFYGEHVLRWMFRELPGLRPFAAAADRLAERSWPRLHDPAVLGANRVPVAAAVYHDDMYVPRELSLVTAAAVRGLRTWVTSEYDHDGLRADGERVLGHLLDLADGRA